MLVSSYALKSLSANGRSILTLRFTGVTSMSDCECVVDDKGLWIFIVVNVVCVEADGGTCCVVGLVGASRSLRIARVGGVMPLDRMRVWVDIEEAIVTVFWTTWEVLWAAEGHTSMPLLVLVLLDVACTKETPAVMPSQSRSNEAPIADAGARGHTHSNDFPNGTHCRGAGHVEGWRHGCRRVQSVAASMNPITNVRVYA